MQSSSCSRRRSSGRNAASATLPGRRDRECPEQSSIRTGIAGRDRTCDLGMKKMPAEAAKARAWSGSPTGAPLDSQLGAMLPAMTNVGDPREAVELLLRDLRARPEGLSSREADRRLVAYGPNELGRRGAGAGRASSPMQLMHPLALLLWVAAGLAFAADAGARRRDRRRDRAERRLRLRPGASGRARGRGAARYLPQQATVIRDGRRTQVDARAVVPGDVLLLAEGDRISADARLLEGALDVDLSTLTGESQPVLRAAAENGRPRRCSRRATSSSAARPASAEAAALVFATGMQTELGRIAALTERVEAEPSPLERQVRRVAWLIALVAVVAGLAFLPIGWLAAGLPLQRRLQLRDRPDRRERAGGAAADDHARARRRRRDASRAAARSSSA